MTMLTRVRGQHVREDPRMRLGDIRFVPQQQRAEMSADTWELLRVDSEKAERYAFARARAMRLQASTSVSVFTPFTDDRPATPAETRAIDPLTRLEQLADQLTEMLHVVGDPTSNATVELLNRRHETRELLQAVQQRTARANDLLRVIDDLLNAKVLT